MVDEDRKRLGSIAKRCDEEERIILIGNKKSFYGEFTTAKSFNERCKNGRVVMEPRKINK